jgi:NAD(P)-dependent dehydrogenase (short-subunit alcohol dehydrogenase family)
MGAPTCHPEIIVHVPQSVRPTLNLGLKGDKRQAGNKFADHFAARVEIVYFTGMISDCRASAAQEYRRPLQLAGQPAGLAAAHVVLASDHGSNISGAVLPVTGGKGL